MRRLFLAVAPALAATAIWLPTAAHAAPPSNDGATAAAIVSSIPFGTTEDTSEATWDPTDPWSCSSNGSVWFSYTPSSDIQLEADTLGSNYDTVLSAWAGSPGSLNLVACNDDFSGAQSKVSLHATA